MLCNGIFISQTTILVPTRRAWWGLRDLVSPPEVSVLRCHLDEDHEKQQTVMRVGEANIEKRRND